MVVVQRQVVPVEEARFGEDYAVAPAPPDTPPVPVAVRGLAGLRAPGPQDMEPGDEANGCVRAGLERPKGKVQAGASHQHVVVDAENRIGAEVCGGHKSVQRHARRSGCIE